MRTQEEIDKWDADSRAKRDKVFADYDARMKVHREEFDRTISRFAKVLFAAVLLILVSKPWEWL